MGEIQALKTQNKEKDKIITFLENRVAELEQFTRSNDLIISGLRTKHRSYARAAMASEDAGPTPRRTTVSRWSNRCFVSWTARVFLLTAETSKHAIPCPIKPKRLHLQ